MKEVFRTGTSTKAQNKYGLDNIGNNEHNSTSGPALFSYINQMAETTYRTRCHTDEKMEE